MFKLVVLFAFVAVAVAKPSGVWLGSPIVEAYSAPAVAVPAAVSSTYRKDVISKPVIAYSAPAFVEAPVVQKVVASPIIPLSAASTHSFRSDLISQPVVIAHQPALVAHQPELVAEPIWPAAASIHPW